ncbi:glutathione peroxidase, partial [Pseudomonas syringae pv. tagetis]
LGTERIKWNFTKLLIGRDGTLVKRFAPFTKPEELTGENESLLR